MFYQRREANMSGDILLARVFQHIFEGLMTPIGHQSSSGEAWQLGCGIAVIDTEDVTGLERTRNAVHPFQRFQVDFENLPIRERAEISLSITFNLFRRSAGFDPGESIVFKTYAQLSRGVSAEHSRMHG